MKGHAKEKLSGLGGEGGGEGARFRLWFTFYEFLRKVLVD
jgi:hypothetical protein